MDRLTGVTPDGLIWAASMLVLDASRQNRSVPRLARCYGPVPGPRGRAGQSSQMSPVSVIVADLRRVRSRLAVPVIVVILLSW